MIGIICMDMYMNKFLKIFFIYKMNIILLFSILIILLGAVFLFYLFVLQPNQNNNDCTGDNCKKNPPSPTNSKDCSPKCINNQTCINGTCQNKYNCLNQNCVLTLNGQYSNDYCDNKCANIPPPSTKGWDTTGKILKYNNTNCVLHGISITCTEWLLKGLGGGCFVGNYPNWGKKFSFDQSDQALKMLSEKLIRKDDTDPVVVPAIRIPLTADYWLNSNYNIVQSDHKDWKKASPALNEQYQSLIKDMVNYFTNNKIVVILDLHWNYGDDTDWNPDGDVGGNGQQPMASKKNTLQFWDIISKFFENNEYVFFELYNEPHTNDINGGDSDFSVWMSGNNTYEGIENIYNEIRKNCNNVVIIAGAHGWACDSDSLIAFDKKHPELKNVMYNFHPYGSSDNGMTDENKGNPTNFENKFIIPMITSINKPLIFTEFGQYCCPPIGSKDTKCGTNYDGIYNKKSMSYVEAILTIAKKYNISWTAWGYEPCNDDKDCNSCEGPQIASNFKLQGTTTKGGEDFVNVFANFY